MNASIRTLGLLAVTLISGPTLAAPVSKPLRSLRPPAPAVEGEEVLHYDVMFWGVPAGTMTLETLPGGVVEVKAHGRKVQKLRGRFKSSAVLSLFQRINDSVESWWDWDGLFSHRYDVSIDESKQTRKLAESFDPMTGKTSLEEEGLREGTIKISRKLQGVHPGYPQDLFTSLFFIRNFLPVEPGRDLRFPVLNDGRQLEGLVQFERTETLPVKPLGGKVPTYVVVPSTFQDGVKQQTEKSYLWFTQDPKHYLVRLEAKVRIGAVVAVLSEIEKPNRSK